MKKKTAVYQGEPGAYSEAAIRATFGELIEARGCPSFEEAFKAVTNKEAEVAFIPIENSLGGSIHANYDLLLRYPNLFIVAETNFQVRHCLLACHGTQASSIKKVYSHFQALAQCDDYLRKNGYKPETFHDTAGSAKYISEQKFGDSAAIASRLAAEKYNLNIIEEGIEDDKNNFTRFIILARKNIIPAPNVPAKTSVVFSLIEQVGALVKALNVFVLRDLDLTKIENRPGRRHLLDATPADGSESNLIQTLNNKLRLQYKEIVEFKEKWNLHQASASNKPYQVLFYLDFSAPLSDVRSVNALTHLAEMAPFVRILGSYSNVDDISKDKQTLFNFILEKVQD